MVYYCVSTRKNTYILKKHFHSEIYGKRYIGACTVKIVMGTSSINVHGAN